MSTEREDAELIEEVAADWLAQREDGFSSAQAREFDRWCRQDPRHVAAVARLEQACKLLERMPLIRGELQPVVEFPAAGRAGARPAGKARRISVLQIVAGLAAVLALTALGWWQWPRSGVEPARYATSAGGYERVLLADGSTLELNANSEARVQLSARDRRVTLLAGEAHFSVAHDTARPFIVEAGGVAVRAVGTAFNVRLAAAAVEVLVTEGRVAVATPEDSNQRSEVRDRRSEDGSQRAEAGGQLAASKPGEGGRSEASGGRVITNFGVVQTELGANERIVIPTRAAKRAAEAIAPSVIEKVEPAAMREALAWQERKLVFAETPLRDVVAQFNRRNRLQLVVGDAVLAERPVGGTFAADNVEGFVRLLESNGTVAVEHRGEFEIVLRQSRDQGR